MDEPTCRAIATKLESCEDLPALPAVMEDPPALTGPVTPLVSPDVPKVKEAPPEPQALQSSEHLSDCKDSCNVWIRTTHVGSLPRPADGILDLNQARGFGACWCLGTVMRYGEIVEGLPYFSGWVN